MNTHEDSITQVKGIGPSTAEMLAQNGIHTIQDLATVSVAELIKLPGFNQRRAEQVKFNAQSCLASPAPAGKNNVAAKATKPATKKKKDFLASEEKPGESLKKVAKSKKKSKDAEKSKSKKKDAKKSKSSKKAKKKK